MPRYTALTGYHQSNPEVWEIQKLGKKIKMNDFIIGVEWEVECGGTNSDNAVQISRAFNYPCDESRKILAERDGSLYDGIEFKTQPATYSFHRDCEHGYNWPAAMATAKSLGYIGEIRRDNGSEEGGHAGLHFNIDRKQLQSGGNPEHNIYTLFVNNQDWIMKKFSRRENTVYKFRYCHYDEDADKILPSEVRTEFSDVNRRLVREINAWREHSSAINFSHNNVIELRFIASTTYVPYFFAALQLVMMMCYCTKHMTLEQIAGIRFPWFLQCAKANGYTEFVDYCRVARINISEGEFSY